MFEHRTQRRVEFADTDMAGIIHFSRYFTWMEAAEHEFWNALGLSVHCELEGIKIGWPRVSADCEFLRPVRFEDVVDILVRLTHIGTKSLRFSVDFEHQGRAIARGALATVCCELTEKGPKGIPIPASIVSRIEVAPEP